MKTYFDFDEKERAALSENDVTAMLDMELMSEGILKVEPPKFMEVAELPQLKKEKWYSIHGLLFKTMTEAESLLGLKIHSEGYDYNGAGYNMRYAEFKEGCEAAVEVKELYVKEEVLALKAILKKRKEALEFNEKANAAYSEASEAQDKCIDGVWSDWNDLQNRKEKMVRIFKTWDDYLKTCNGDNKTAAAFLSKVYTAEEVKQAAEWLGKENPLVIIEAANEAAPEPVAV